MIRLRERLEQSASFVLGIDRVERRRVGEERRELGEVRDEIAGAGASACAASAGGRG